MMLHGKYKDSRPYGFRQEGFSMFFPICVKYVTPEVGPFLSKLGRGLSGDAAYQI